MTQDEAEMMAEILSQNGILTNALKDAESRARELEEGLIQARLDEGEAVDKANALQALIDETKQEIAGVKTYWKVLLELKRPYGGVPLDLVNLDDAINALGGAIA